MRIIGFNFSKIAAERFSDTRPTSISADIKFLNLEKEEFELLKEEDALKASFSFIVNYQSESKNENKEKKEKEANGQNVGLISFEGHITLSTTKDESKEIMKQWKKKEIAESFRLPLFNFVLKKCTVKALDLEDQLGLPSHLPFPQLKAQKNQ